ncbi:MAG: MarR family transcriptional regulator [Thaumarchaeota archaeon]|nr:MarR family transcriptional regulator [Nitrososphaerota archaeon]
MNIKVNLDPKNSIGLIVKSTEKAIGYVLDQEIKEKCGITGGQWKIVIALAIQDGMSQKELADMIFVETPTLVSLLDKMEKTGLIKRQSDSKDRRTNKILLTSKAKKQSPEIVECILDIRNVITKNISKNEIKTTKNTLKIMTQNAESFMKQKKVND